MLINFVLVNPQLPNNIGFSLRSMANFGITNLTVVNPNNANFINLLNNTDAGALQKVNITVVNSVATAVANSQIVLALSARKRSISKPIINLHNCFNYLQNNNVNVASSSIAVLFGAEQSGLSNASLQHANYLVSINNNKDFPSLNLSHAVALVAYEYFNFMQSMVNANNSNNVSAVSSSADIDFLMQDLTQKLENRGYFSQPTRKPITISNLHNIFLKANLTNQEVKTLIGVNKMLYGKNN